MSSVSTAPSRDTTFDHRLSLSQLTGVRQCLADFVTLTKPKIAVLALLTVTLGYALAAAPAADVTPIWTWKLVETLAAIALVAASSSAFNQYLERHIDRRMLRTAQRPLPAGRLSPWAVLCFALLTGVAGLVWLTLRINSLTAGLSALTLVLYAGIYTPLKRFTTLNTVVGAIPGALPPVLGWTAAGGTLDSGAWSLFAILFLWQFPHFMAIAWLYRDDYRSAGLRMLPVDDPQGRRTGLTAVAYAAVLWAVSGQPAVQGLSGSGYVLAAMLLGALYLAAAGLFWARPSVPAAKKLLWMSLIYLPLLLLALVADRLRLLS